MSTTLKKRCEIAIAKALVLNPVLKTLVPKIWDSNAKVRLPHLYIQATPDGDEYEGLYGMGIYMVNCQVSLRGLPRKGYTLDDYMHEVENLFHQWVGLDALGWQRISRPYGVNFHGVIPRQVPSTIEGDNRVELAGVGLIARKI